MNELTPFYYSELPQERANYQNFVAPTWDSLQATAAEAWRYSPLDSVLRIGEINRLQADQTDALVDFQSAKVEADEIGLKLEDRTYRRRELDELLQRKREQDEIDTVLARSEQSFGAMAGRFGVALATSILDPTNVASAFIPVFGQARYAKMVAQAGTAGGRAAVRAGVGAAEGTIGAALVEPMVLAASAQEYGDYDLSDSVLNVLFGGVMGGGLHVTAGLGRDILIGPPKADVNPHEAPKGMDRNSELLDSVSQTTREAYYQIVLAKMARGEIPNADIITYVDPLASFNQAAIRPDVTPKYGPIRSEFYDVKRQAVLDELTAMEAELPKTRPTLGTGFVEDAAGQVDELKARISESNIRVQELKAEQRRIGQRKWRKSGKQPEMDQLRQQVSDDTAALERVRRRLDAEQEIQTQNRTSANLRKSIADTKARVESRQAIKHSAMHPAVRSRIITRLTEVAAERREPHIALEQELAKVRGPRRLEDSFTYSKESLEELYLTLREVADVSDAVDADTDTLDAKIISSADSDEKLILAAEDRTMAEAIVQAEADSPKWEALANDLSSCVGKA